MDWKRMTPPQRAMTTEPRTHAERKGRMWRGKVFSGSRLWNTQLSTDLTTKVTRLEVPVYFP